MAPPLGLHWSRFLGYILVAYKATLLSLVKQHLSRFSGYIYVA